MNTVPCILTYLTSFPHFNFVRIFYGFLRALRILSHKTLADIFPNSPFSGSFWYMYGMWAVFFNLVQSIIHIISSKNCIPKMSSPIVRYQKFNFPRVSSFTFLTYVPICLCSNTLCGAVLSWPPPAVNNPFLPHWVFNTLSLPSMKFLHVQDCVSMHQTFL